MAQALFERAKLADNAEEEMGYMEMSIEHFENALRLDPENVAAHYGLAQIYARLDRPEQEDKHRQLHDKYRPDDNAHDVAVGAARRRDNAANQASESVVIYDLQRPGAPNQ